MERLTLTQARTRVAANVSAAGLTVDDIHWMEPDREALLIAGLLPGADGQDERDALQAIALALLGYRAHLEYEAGRAAVLSAFVGPVVDVVVKPGDRVLDVEDA